MTRAHVRHVTLCTRRQFEACHSIRRSIKHAKDFSFKNDVCDIVAFPCVKTVLFLQQDVLESRSRVVVLLIKLFPLKT